MKQKREKKKGNDAVDVVQGAMGDEKSKRKQSDHHTMMNDEQGDKDDSPALAVGGENGVSSVMAARLAGLIPVVADEGFSNVAGAQSEMILSKEKYYALKG